MNRLQRERLQRLEQRHEAKRESNTRSRFYTMFPDTGPYRRELYPKHLRFFAAGKYHTERCFLAANRVGKTEAGTYEVVCHLTGLYPAWWDGRRFDHPITAWAAGDSYQTVRDILQEKFLGQPGQLGTGMIPGHLIIKTTPRSGLPEAVEKIYVRHKSGGISSLVLKSYNSGRESFTGTAIDVVWFDEEVSEDIYMEGLTRTMTKGGISILTFTPLNGCTPVVMRFLPQLGV